MQKAKKTPLSSSIIKSLTKKSKPPKEKRDDFGAVITEYLMLSCDAAGEFVVDIMPPVLKKMLKQIIKMVTLVFTFFFSG